MAGNWLRRNALLLLLIFIPVALALRYLFGVRGLAIFITSALAIIPLAGLMGRATETLAERLGEGIGGLLNATFGNAAELIIAIVALRAGLVDLVKASITGSIIGNILLVFGASALYGGLRYRTQKFNATAASLGATLLVLSAIGLVVPAIFHLLVQGNPRAHERELSLEIAIVLMATYLLSLFFTLHTHRHLYIGVGGQPDLSAAGGSIPGRGGEEVEGAGGGEPLAISDDRERGASAELHMTPAEDSETAPERAPEDGGTGRAFLLLTAATVGIAIMSELLVGAVEAAADALGMTDIFVGVILVAIIGNAAEHSTAILMAGKNRMDTAIQIAVGSSIQIALFVAPLLVFLSYWIAPQPMDLIFTTLEVVAITGAVGIMAFISNDGESHWMEGVQLLAVYLILGIAFYFFPA
jgi:Ca2+:H+ antiporter